MRYLIAILASLVLVLAACQSEEDPFAGDGSPEGTIDIFGSPSPTTDMSPGTSPDASATGSPDMTTDSSPSATAGDSPTASPGTTDDADASPTGSPATGVGDDCEESFTDVPDITQLTSLGDLADAMEALDETISSCDSVDEWTAQADEQLSLPGMDLDAESFLRARCDESDELDDEDLCEEF
jgi:hypothetical protein